MFEEDEVEYLKGTGFYHEVLSQKENIKDQFDRLCEAVPAVKSMFFFQEFLEVMAVINSRQLAYRDKKKNKLALIPLVDMINHSN